MSSREKLASFLKALDNAGIMSFDKNSFNHRLKLQKYVFIAQKFELGTNYNYSLYIHGPYSPNLARDYYNIGDFKNRKPIELRPTFVSLIKNKSEEWLELASTILMIKERYENIDHETLISLVTTVKPFAKKETLLKIIRNLESITT